MKIQIKENERIDDLEYKGLKIIQNRKGFCFGIDSILLTDFAKGIKKESKVIDLGTGTGIIPILLSSKSRASKFWGIEIQSEVAEMAQRSILLNSLEEKITIINKDIKQLEENFEKNSIDVIVANPPYKKANCGIKNENQSKVIARHEIKANLEDFICISSKLLKTHGELYMIHRPERLIDIVELCRKYKIEPKNIRMVYPNEESKPNMILIKAVKQSGKFLIIEKPLIVYQKNGKYTEEILKIYGKETVK